MTYETTDPNFTVSWLLGLQSRRPFRATCPRLRRDYDSQDPDFSISWLLGIHSEKEISSQCRKMNFNSVKPTKCLPFGRLDPDTLRRLNKKARRAKTRKLKASSEEELKIITSSADKLWEVEAGFGLKRLFHIPPSEEEAVEEEEEAELDDESLVLATVEFLDLCSDMHGLLPRIEEDLDRDDDREDLSDTESEAESIDGVSPEDDECDSPAKNEWLRLKKTEFAENKYLDQLMSLPGLEEAKTMFLHVRAQIKAATRRETSIPKDNFDRVFAGNQGTGKSTLANLYAKFLLEERLFEPQDNRKQAIQITNIRESYFNTDNVLRRVSMATSKDSGCIVVIDDAHMMYSGECLWSLHTQLKQLPGTIVLILTGDLNDGLSGQLNYRTSVETQLGIMKLPNYTEEQLQVIFQRMVQQRFHKKMHLDESAVGTVVKRLLRGVNKNAFSNIWAVKKAVDSATGRQVERFRRARQEGNYLEDWVMTAEDLLGDRPRLTPDKSIAWTQLQELKGLEQVRDSVVSVINQANQNHDRELKGLEPLRANMNQVFLGNPGTGKTTVAKLYGKLLADNGLLSKGDLFIRTPADLIGPYLGWSESNTKEALADAKGGVLIIDDAHMLDPGTHNGRCEFRRAVLDTLVAEVTGAPGEDRCVILCGYPEHMKEMYANADPGLARRFPLDTAFVFEDFDADKLAGIFDMKLQKDGVRVTEKARQVAFDMLQRASVRPSFVNGGEVDNIISKGLLARSKRVNGAMTSAGPAGVDLDHFPVEPADFDPDWGRNTGAAINTRALFDGFVGFEDIISKFEGYQYMAQGMRLRNIDPRPYIPFTYVFKGPPGTGKTTTARKLGHIFYDMGLLAAPEVVEVSASQLIGEYCGQTGTKTARLLESALGKVLFIDEAYRLADSNSSFGNEAIGEIVDAVTKTKFARKMVIVLAGYDEDMDRLMRTNAGLRSRFATELRFQPMQAEQCLKQLREAVEKVGITVPMTTDMDSKTRTTLFVSLGRMSGEKGWASGRSVETIAERVITHIFKQVAMKGYTGSELSVSGGDLVRILAKEGVVGVESRRWNERPMGAKQVMTLKDLEGGDY